MRKNKMMRAASGLLVAVLLTTCVISGTFAKYVTTNSGTDSARVAKFGVTIEVADDMNLFNTAYVTSDDSYNGTNDPKKASVEVNASSKDNLVAPGTSGSMQFSIKGTPEVATKLDVVFKTIKTIQLQPATYTLAAGKFSEAEAKVTTTQVYEPILWTLKEGDTELIKGGTLAEVKNKLDSLTSYKEPNATYDKTYTLSWEWPFEGNVTGATWENENAPYESAEQVNFLDTYLGNEENLQTEAFNLNITVTQVD